VQEGNTTGVIFSQKLRDLMDRKDKTQDDVARACDLSQPAVSKWLKGTVPGGEQLSRLADLFGVSTDFLLGRETSEAETPHGEAEETAEPAVRSAAEQLSVLHDHDPPSFEVAQRTIEHLHGKLRDVNYKRPPQSAPEYEQRGPATVRKDEAVEEAARKALQRISEQPPEREPEPEVAAGSIVSPKTKRIRKVEKLPGHRN
jgi:transcriptional regulator with XRE-family HTH domain